MLIGLAATLKLTPAVFVLYFLRRGDGRAARVSGLSWLPATRSVRAPARRVRKA
jgi:alpha-1,2-mannosyltransferase